MTVIALGVHVVDVLARPIEAIPAGQGGQLVDEIRITPAGTAAGTAVTLAKLGATVRSAGAIGTDALGDVLLDLLGRHGVDTTPAGPPRRRADVGERPADPARRLAPGLPRRRRERDVLRGRRAVGRDRRGDPPAPRGARVHGR